MKLLTKSVSALNWIIVKNAVVDRASLKPYTIRVGERSLTAFVDDTDLMARCPYDLEPGSYPVTVNGAELGRVLVDSV